MAPKIRGWKLCPQNWKWWNSEWFSYIANLEFVFVCLWLYQSWLSDAKTFFFLSKLTCVLKNAMQQFMHEKIR